MDLLSSKNCSKNLHTCQWERDILLGFAVVFLLLNFVQLGYTHRARLFRVLRRGAQQIPDGDEEPIIGIRD